MNSSVAVASLYNPANDSLPVLETKGEFLKGAVQHDYNLACSYAVVLV